jgi:hypothetical protein
VVVDKKVLALGKMSKTQQFHQPLLPHAFWVKYDQKLWAQEELTEKLFAYFRSTFFV